jgi:hypothetical protein
LNSPGNRSPACAARNDGRPRTTLGRRTPAERLHELLPAAPLVKCKMIRLRGSPPRLPTARGMREREEPGQSSGPVGVAVPRCRQIRLKDVRVERDVVLEPRRKEERQAVGQPYSEIGQRYSPFSLVDRILGDVLWYGVRAVAGSAGSWWRRSPSPPATDLPQDGQPPGPRAAHSGCVGRPGPIQVPSGGWPNRYSAP